MATQDESGIEFSILPEESQQHFRLLELPADLLAVLTSENAPILQLKSQDGPPGHALDSNAVLCTPDKTYSLRQVSTSNEVYVTRPASISDGSLSHPALEAIAQCNSTLELQATKNPSAIPHIKSILPTYTTTGLHDSKEAVSKEQLFSNIPLSDAECEQAWTELACFEIEGPRRGLIPSDGIKLKAWQAVLEGATAMGVDLMQRLDEHDQSFTSHLEGDWPNELSKAVLKSMASTTSTNDLQLNETQCVRTVGKMLLKERTYSSSSKSLPVKAFTAAWADLLPEKWRAQAEISLLEGYYWLENGGQDIRFVDNAAGIGSAADGGTSEETKSTLGAKRKWHEKFRASKKTA